MQPAKIPCVLYGRISLDDMGTEKGVGRQLADGRALAEAKGWTVVAEYSDNDISATTGKHRPGYSEMMAAAQRGEFERIVCYHTSRLWRNRNERADAIGKLGKGQVSVNAVKGPELDLSTAAGRGMAGLLGEFDTMESEVKGERVARAALERAQEGRASGQVAYGWRRVQERDERGMVISWHDVVDEPAAAVVSGIVDGLLAGDTLRGIAEGLNAAGVPTPKQAGAWRNTTVRKLALRPANVADRVHQGKVIGPAAWKPIVDRDKHERVVALLSDTARVTSRSGARRHLLTSGIGECGVCSAVLRHAVQRGRYGKPQALYACAGRGCTGRNSERVDDHVAKIVVTKLSDPNLADMYGPDEQAATVAAERAEGIRARLDSAADQFADEVIDATQLARITEKLRPQLQAAEREATTARRGSGLDVLDGMVGDAAAEAWLDAPVQRRRAVLEVLGFVVKIMPTRRGPGFEPADVIVETRP